MTGIFSYLGPSIESALATFVTQTSAQLSATLVPPATLAVTLTIVLYGLAVVRGTVTEPLWGLILQALWISLVLTIALSAGVYQEQVVTAVNDAADTLVAASNQAGTDVYGTLDALDAQAGDISARYLQLGVGSLPVGGYLDLATGFLMAITFALVLLVAGGYVILAKVMLALVLSVGPLFIFTLAFAPTRRFFNAWLSQLVHQLILMMLMAATLGLVNRIYGNYLTQLRAGIETNNPVIELLDLVILSGALVVIVLQLPRLAGGLSQGSAISGLPAAVHGLSRAWPTEAKRQMPGTAVSLPPSRPPSSPQSTP